MIKPRMKSIALALGLLVTVSSAKFLPYPERSMKYPEEQGWEAHLQSHWTYWKSHFLNDGLVTATTPSGTVSNVSEAQSYGMLLALWFNDQTTFNAIWTTTENKFWQSGSKWYAWNITNFDANFAGDADQDIAGALIFASALVDSGYWSNSTVGGNTYKSKALILLPSLWSNFVDQSNHQIQSYPSAGNGSRNPSYHMPAWDSVFQEFATKNGLSESWSSARTAAYNLFSVQPSAADGMARNFSTSTGDGGSGTSSPNSYDMGFDAIRVPWRIGMDAIWYHNHNAVSWCESVWNHSVVNPDSAGMYTISSSIGSSKLYGYSTGSDSKYELAMPTTMWGTCAVSVQDSSSKGYTAASKLLGRLTPGVVNHDYFLLTSNSDTTTSSAPNKNYYTQTLSLLGALAMDGRAWNVWDDLMHKWTAPDTFAKVTSLTATPDTLYALTGTTKIRAKFSHSISWTLTMTGSSSGSYTYTGTGDSINVSWTPSTNKTGLKAYTMGESVAAKVSYSTTTVVPTGTASLTLYLVSSSGLSETRGSHLSALSWTTAGLRLPPGLVENGQSYDVRVLDLMGRQQGVSRTAVARSSGDVTVLDLQPQRMDKAGFVEVRSPDGSRVQLMLPPVR